MKDKNIIKIELPSIGVLGVKSIEKRTNGNVVETRKGSFTHKYIAPFFLVVEDDLAKQVIEIIASEFPSLPRKYIHSGVWVNQAACLLGFLMYAKELESTNVPQFSILSIDDGDIKTEEKEKRLKKLLKGNYFGEELEVAKKTLSELMLSFKLEYFNVKKGLPEYNHKKWFEEINKEIILSIDKPSNLYEERKVESLMGLIEFSKSIKLDDYHSYYEELKKFRPSNTFHLTEYFVLNAIKKYNKSKWDLYVGHIRDALVDVEEENRKRFVDADMYFSQRNSNALQRTSR